MSYLCIFGLDVSVGGRTGRSTQVSLQTGVTSQMILYLKSSTHSPPPLALHSVIDEKSQEIIIR